MPEFSYCPSCRSHHLGPVPCGLSFRDRMRTVRLDPAALETRTPRNYYDAEAVEQVFTEEGRDRMMRETQGYGYTRTDEHGQDFYRNRKSGDWERVPADVMDRVYLGGDTERDARDP